MEVANRKSRVSDLGQSLFPRYAFSWFNSFYSQSVTISCVADADGASLLLLIVCGSIARDLSSNNDYVEHRTLRI
jgi:hypothetical protein